MTTWTTLRVARRADEALNILDEHGQCIAIITPTCLTPSRVTLVCEGPPSTRFVRDDANEPTQGNEP